MRITSLLPVVLACAVGLASRNAHAQTALDLSTTFGPTVLTTTGAVVAIILLTRKDDSKTTKTTAGKSAEVFLRSHHLQLAQDLATGNGPLLSDLARSLELLPENAAAFGPLLREHRKELLPYCDVTTLSTERALAFAERVTAILESHEGIRADLKTVASSNAIN